LKLFKSVVIIFDSIGISDNISILFSIIFHKCTSSFSRFQDVNIFIVQILSPVVVIILSGSNSIELLELKYTIADPPMRGKFSSKTMTIL
jgi:hypothetical protein